MSDFKFWGWDKKPRTMLRFIKPGDIFCFQLDGNTYGFGRIISKVHIGHVGEIFDFNSKIPNISEVDISSAKRKLPPLVLDTYSLFDKKIEKGSDWRIIGHQINYTPTDIDNVYFTYDVENSCYKVDIYDNDYPITEAESQKYPPLSPHSDYQVRELLGVT